MAFLEIQNVEIVGISACVPKTIEENISLEVFQEGEAERFISGTGVERRRIANQATTTSDMCYHAAEKLIQDLNWSKAEIDCLVFVTQTPDYILPATACILQQRLGLNEECYAIDISLGCSGWVYGASIISALLQNGNFKKGILLTGDTILKQSSKQDKSAWPLFGEAGTATAFSFNTKANTLKFHLATDGSGSGAIIIPDGGYRSSFSDKSLINEKIEDGINRNKTQLVLNGMDVFSFGINKAPETIEKLCQHFSIDKETVDYFVFHQANLFMNEKIRKKLKLPVEKVPYSLKNFGNTSSATIVLTIVTELADKIKDGTHNLIACGFGVGLSWGCVSFDTKNLVCSDLIEI
jgi:3-oxoacyl-[acyl-carrier-protein] synthase-3